jgi:hypothetical protein
VTQVIALASTQDVITMRFRGGCGELPLQGLWTRESDGQAGTALKKRD